MRAYDPVQKLQAWRAELRAVCGFTAETGDVASLVARGGQVLGVVGTAWELAYPIDTAKSREPQTLGVDPTLAVTINLAYSAVASMLFMWAVARLVGIRRAACRPEPTL